MSTPTYLAVDLETTGLDPTRHRILELAFQVLDEELEPIGSHTTIVWAPAGALAECQGPAREMHLRTGLLTTSLDAVKINGTAVPLHEIEDYLLQVVACFPAKPILAGQSVQFDRKFLDHWMPSLAARLKHQHLDARTVLFLAPELEPEFEGVKHRALADLRHSVKILRAARDILRGAHQ